MLVSRVRCRSIRRCLKSGDVLLAIDDLPIASDATVELEGERVEMPEVVERKFKGDRVKLDILRDKKPMTVTLELVSWPYTFQATAMMCARATSFMEASVSTAHPRLGRGLSQPICVSGIISIISSWNKSIWSTPRSSS